MAASRVARQGRRCCAQPAHLSAGLFFLLPASARELVPCAPRATSPGSTLRLPPPSPTPQFNPQGFSLSSLPPQPTSPLAPRLFISSPPNRLCAQAQSALTTEVASVVSVPPHSSIPPLSRDPPATWSLHMFGHSHRGGGGGGGHRRRRDEDYPVHETDVPATQIGEQTGPLHDVDALLAADQQRQLASFSFGGVADQLPPSPELIVQGYGRVALPLVDPAEAARLAATCQQAPFGRGTETLVDTAVRRTWQLDPAAFAVHGAEWNDGIAAFGPLIAEKMGFAGTPLSLEPYKLLLYEPGGHFACHRDTEKEDGMFATLVIQLPSVHSGGQLIVYRNGVPIFHDFGAARGTAASQCHYAVHYADAEHEVTPVTQGYRLALVYSVCWPASQGEPTVPPTSADADGTAALAAALGKLADEERRFYHLLDHDYTAKSIKQLGERALKGVDRERVASLCAASRLLSQDRRYAFYIAEATRKTLHAFDGPESGWSEYWEPVIRFERYQRLDGTRIPGDASLGHLFTNRDVLNPDSKSMLQLWAGHRRQESGWLGNDGPSQDTIYSKYVLIAWPERLAGVFEVLAQHDTRALKALVATQPTDAQLIELLDAIKASIALSEVPREAGAGRRRGGRGEDRGPAHAAAARDPQCARRAAVQRGSL
ncbi:uncharacterized protein PFL1_05993 [Pseudozyma flocculosa PF-1]|uniref:Fe2OG dioxygenase domain-containing protein n=1 Tax=Pseudozyma flocculosa PF-1 TaxID=1277687 RepID=A0A061H3A5_9BASI|nr:uncharacterized protein PFL1_05993 [Pseudozyma flocculosa PF-1]EPQ26345.1 hypothetical protein PFL1_05993 [Pseudozyma flocculosa PF-1]